MNQIQKKKIRNMLTSHLIFDEPLAKYTTFGIGGPARCMVYPDNQNELKGFIKHLTTVDSSELRVITAETMAYLNYLRRFAK